MEAAAALFGALMTLGACYSFGSVIAERLGLRPSRMEKFPFALVLGASVLHLVIFAVFVLRIAYTPVLVAVLIGALAIGTVSGDWRLVAKDSGAANAGASNEGPNKATPNKEAVGEDARNKLSPLLRYLLGAVVAGYSVLYLTNAWAPEFSPDGASYHLGLVARYLRAHGFVPVTTNVYSSLSEGMEMLFAAAFVIGRHSAAALVHLGFLIALGIAVVAYGYRIGKPRAGVLAALLMCICPVVGVVGTSAYVDAAAALAAFLVFYLTQIWDERRGAGVLVAIGFVGGYCYAVKYTIAVMLIYAAAYVLWKERRVRPVLILFASASIMILPWMAKDWIYWHNPIAPFGNTIFRNPFIHPEFERFWSQMLRTYYMPSLRPLPLEVTIRGGILGGALGPALLAAPLALLALGRSQGRRLLAPAALLLAVYFGNIGTRFLIPVLPFVSLALALALDRAAPVMALLVLGHAVASWPSVFNRYSNAWALLRVPFKAALRITPEASYLGLQRDYQFVRMIEANVPDGGRVLAVNVLPQAYTSRDILVGYQGALNAVLEDMLDVAASDVSRPERVWNFKFPSRSVRGLRVVQTATMPKPDELWSVHEMRVLSHGSELARDTRWRLSAFPNPWDVTMAFDNSEATRWRTWETARPGNYIGVDFGREQTVDEVRLETSSDDWYEKFRLEVADAQGRWTPMNAGDVHFEELKMTYDGSIKRAATYELHLRGVDYLIMRDTDWAGPIFFADPASWGLKAVARSGETGKGATLYHVVPQVKP